MTAKMVDLEANCLITDCEGALGSCFLFAAKPYHETCDDINTFI